MSRPVPISRRLVARAASVLRPGQSFSVDENGWWANAQPEATFVSPALHFTPYAEVERGVRRNWKHEPRPGDTIIDVGAGIGEETVVFARRVGDAGRVVAIEAHPQTFACLQETVRRSGLRNVTAIFCAVADSDGTATISSGDDHLANSLVAADDGVRVPARSLDSLAAELGLGRVDFLKMNIEGAEALAVRGMSAIAPRLRQLAISCHDFRADHGDSEGFRTKMQVRAALERFGFRIETRPDSPEDWLRDYLYGRREAA